MKMKAIYWTLLLLFLGAVAGVNAQVTIGSQDEPHPAAVLDLKSSTQGLLLPNVALNMSDLTDFVLDGAADKTTAKGMIVYNTEDKNVYVWNGVRWNNLSGRPVVDVVIPPSVAGVERMTGLYDLNGDGLLAEDEKVEMYVFDSDNSSGSQWSTVDTEYYGAISMVDGLENCEKALSSKGAGTVLPAIKVCDDLNTTAPGTGGKWYLPAVGEFLPPLVNYIKSTGGTGSYWTSTEYDANGTGAEDAYQVASISTSAKRDGYKTDTKKVRCVWRANNPVQVQ